jgi:hypothetical protein
LDVTENTRISMQVWSEVMGREQSQYCFFAYCARGDVSESERHMSQLVTTYTNQTPLYFKTEDSDITLEQNADLTSKTRTFTKRDVEKRMNLTWKHKNREAVVYNAVAYRGGDLGGPEPPPPEIPKFWQSVAEFPVPRKIHPQQPNNTGFTYLQIDRNPRLGGYRPQIPVPSVLNWICLNPPRTKFLGTPLV